MSWLPRLGFALVALLFVWAAYLQLNDVDPALWVTVYAVAAVCAAASALGRPLPVAVPVVVGAVCAVWALWLATLVFGGGEVRQMFPEEEGTGLAVVDTEEGREMGGLAIIAVTMALVTLHSRRNKERSAA